MEIQEIKKCLEATELPPEYCEPETSIDLSGSSSSCSLIADTNLKWILLTGLEKSTSIDNVTSYLKKMWLDIEFTVEYLDTKGDMSLFKVGTDQLLYSELLDPIKWPIGLKEEVFISFFLRKITITM